MAAEIVCCHGIRMCINRLLDVDVIFIYEVEI